MLFTARHLPLVIGLGVGFASPLSAQPALAHLSQIEGTVTRLHQSGSARPNSGELRRDQAVAADAREGGPATAVVGMVLVAGDQIVTAVGRAEVTFVDGSVMHLDQHTQVTIAAAARIRLIDGRISLRTTTAYSAETGTGIVHVLPEGVFELTASANNRDVLVHVVEGDARIESPWGFESIRSPHTAFVAGPTGQPFVTTSIQTRHDSFVQWCNARYVAIMSASAGFRAGQLRGDLAVATVGREGGPPPTFLPYAHPTYRQFVYERSLGKARFDPKRSDVRIRNEQVVRGERRRDTSASGHESGPVRRVESPKQTDRDDRPRTQPRGAARPWGAPVRGASKGAAARQP